MGFKGLLNMKTDGIPAKLGYYVFDLFDPQNMLIKLENGVIPITISKTTWKPGPIECYYSGPLTTLKLLYVDTIQCDSVHIICERPCIASWSMDILRRREAIEIFTGGFGIGNAVKPLVDAQCEDSSRENEESDIKRYLDGIEHIFNRLKTLKSDFDEILKKARTSYPASVEFEGWQKNLIDLVVDDNMDCDASMNMPLAKSGGTKQASTSDSWQGVMEGAQDIVETPTQFFSHVEIIKRVEKAIKVYEKLQMLDFSLGLTQELGEVADAKENDPNRKCCGS
ncbi:hypothetical protein Ccrd_015002 [Cynara cardunculus var. scolymus]|uniref:Uncharacterized protein n=1 Tax=Cynara cardunculus var. scolymus TaxID=59895 RepID=A0A118K3X5_CYNCS|nr:hypothetical protein Ccrd_015002 [Cynara cardunculus var. scolymus]